MKRIQLLKSYFPPIIKLIFLLFVCFGNRLNAQTDTLTITNIRAAVVPNQPELTNSDSLIVGLVITVNQENTNVNQLTIRFSTDSLQSNNNSKDIVITAQNNTYAISGYKTFIEQIAEVNYLIFEFKLLNDKNYKWLSVIATNKTNKISNKSYLKFIN